MQEQHGEKGVSLGADVVFLIIHIALQLFEVWLWTLQTAEESILRQSHSDLYQRMFILIECATAADELFQEFSNSPLNFCWKLKH